MLVDHCAFHVLEQAHLTTPPDGVVKLVTLVNIQVHRHGATGSIQHRLRHAELVVVGAGFKFAGNGDMRQGCGLSDIIIALHAPFRAIQILGRVERIVVSVLTDFRQAEGAREGVVCTRIRVGRNHLALGENHFLSFLNHGGTAIAFQEDQVCHFVVANTDINRGNMQVLVAHISGGDCVIDAAVVNALDAQITVVSDIVIDGLNQQLDWLEPVGIRKRY